MLRKNENVKLKNVKLKTLEEDEVSRENSGDRPRATIKELVVFGVP